MDIYHQNKQMNRCSLIDVFKTQESWERDEWMIINTAYENRKNLGNASESFTDKKSIPYHY